MGAFRRAVLPDYFDAALFQQEFEAAVAEDKILKGYARVTETLKARDARVQKLWKDKWVAMRAEIVAVQKEMEKMRKRLRNRVLIASQFHSKSMAKSLKHHIVRDKIKHRKSVIWSATVTRHMKAHHSAEFTRFRYRSTERMRIWRKQRDRRINEQYNETGEVRPGSLPRFLLDPLRDEDHVHESALERGSAEGSQGQQDRTDRAGGESGGANAVGDQPNSIGQTGNDQSSGTGMDQMAGVELGQPVHGVELCHDAQRLDPGHGTIERDAVDDHGRAHIEVDQQPQVGSQIIDAPNVAVGHS